MISATSGWIPGWDWDSSTVLILGSGPSAAGLEISRLRNTILIGLNDAWVHAARAEWSPQDVALVAFWMDPGLSARRYAKTSEDDRGRVSLFVTEAGEAKAFANQAVSSAHLVREWERCPKMEDFGRAKFWTGRTVSTAALQYAIDCGAKRVVLVGVDAFQLEDREYGIETEWTEARKSNNVESIKFRDGDRIGFAKHDLWVEEHRRLRLILEKREVMLGASLDEPGIYNAGEMSRVDAWPKVNLVDLLKSSKRR